MSQFLPTPLTPSKNLSDVASASAAATNLGLGSGSSPTFAAATINGAVAAQHFVGSGSTPTVAVGSAAGSGSASITGTDASMQVTVVTGSGASNGVLFTVTFASAFSVAPAPVFSPGISLTSQDLASQAIWISSTTTTLTINSKLFSSGLTLVFNIKP